MSRYIYRKEKTFIFEDNKDNKKVLHIVETSDRMTAKKKIEISSKYGATHITLVFTYHTARGTNPFSSGAIFKYYNLIDGKFFHYRSGSLVN